MRDVQTHLFYFWLFLKVSLVAGISVFTMRRAGYSPIVNDERRLVELLGKRFELSRTLSAESITSVPRARPATRGRAADATA